MPFIEAVREIPVKLATGLRDLTRGYSDEDLREARRILSGEITPRDRLRFRLTIEDRLWNLPGGASYSLTGLQLDATIDPIALGLEERLQALHALPDSQIDQTLTKWARARLQSWHQLPGSPC